MNFVPLQRVACDLDITILLAVSILLSPLLCHATSYSSGPLCVSMPVTAHPAPASPYSIIRCLHTVGPILRDLREILQTLQKGTSATHESKL